MADKDKGMEPASNNDQLVRTVPGTDIGGHDTAGVDGEKRTERAGDLLGTPNSEPSKATEDSRKQATEQSDFVAKEVDRANREDLPRLGGDTGPGNWKPEEGGPPEFLADAKSHQTEKQSGGVTTANVPATPAVTVTSTTSTSKK